MKTYLPIQFATLILLSFSLLFNCGSITDSEKTTNSKKNSDSPFVTTNGGNFIVEGSVFRFAGSNAYYLPNYQKLDPSLVDRTLDLFEQTGVRVIRMWGFYDGYDCGYSAQDSTENVIQLQPGIYNEKALQDLDKVIAKGKERGIMFIIPFINFWDELGGICQYNTWAGAQDPSGNMDFFLNSSETQRWYKNYIKMLLNRVNTVTGIAYKDEPAIFSWQIINEGRYRGKNPEILRNWYQEIAAYIKSIDSNHLVGTGEEGFDSDTPSRYSKNQYSNTYVLRANEGTSYILNTSISEIDYGNAHWYPPDFGFGYEASENLLTAQIAWLQDHKNIAQELDKPFLLGEYGFPGWGDQRNKTIYKQLWETAESINLDGNLLWQLTPNYVKCYEFGGNICWPDARNDEELYNGFKTHIENINSTK